MMKYKLAENPFFSIQGEGSFIGIPSNFIRLFGCSLKCKWCDTAYSWKQNYILMSSSEILGRLNQKCKHVVVTGGEPLEQDISELLRLLYEKGFLIELETNGTIFPSCLSYVRKWNVSPKLKSSGVEKSKRINYEVLTKFVELTFSNHQVEFKFAVRDLSDFEEMITLIRKLSIPREHVSVMPVAVSSDGILGGLRSLVEVCKRENIRLLPRLHVLIWGNRRCV